jgi:hypothetical protein
MLASVLGMVLSIQFGIAKTYALGACFYIVCAITLVVSCRTNPWTKTAAELVATGSFAPRDEAIS